MRPASRALLSAGKRIAIRASGKRRTTRFGMPDPKATSYRPVIVLFIMTALMALATSHASVGTLFTLRAVQWFIAFSMAVLALLNARRLGQPTRPWSWVVGAGAVLTCCAVLTWIESPLGLTLALYAGAVGLLWLFEPWHVPTFVDERERRFPD